MNPWTRALPPTGTLRVGVGVIGLAYLVLGIAGFALVGSDMGYDPSRTVWLFGASGLLNIGHTGVGALGLLISVVPTRGSAATGHAT